MKSIITLVSLCLAFSACSSKSVQKSLGTYRLEKAKVKKVKTVAIVAYDLMEYVPEGLAGKVSGMANQAQAAANAKSVASELALKSYRNMVKAFEDNGWKVIPISKVKNNKFYKTVFKDRNRKYNVVPNSFHRPNHIKGILRPTKGTYFLKKEHKEGLIQALNVDAIIGVRVSMFTKLKGAFGVGSNYLKSSLEFQMYSAGEPKAIWMDLQFEGPESEESLGFMSGMADIKEVARQTPPLAGQTINSLFKTLQ